MGISTRVVKNSTTCIVYIFVKNFEIDKNLIILK